MYPTYTWAAKDVAFGVNVERGIDVPVLNTPLVLFNGLSNARLDILSCWASSKVYKLAQGGSVPKLLACRVSAVVGGSQGVKTHYDSSSPLPSQVIGVSGCSLAVSEVIARHSIAVAGGLNGPAAAMNLSPQMKGPSSRAALISPIVLREGEGFALAPDPDDLVGPSGPYTVLITVRNDLDGSLTTFLFVGQVLSDVSATAIGAIFNGVGSGIVVSVNSIEIFCSSTLPNGNFNDLISVSSYITGGPPNLSLPVGSAFDESHLIVPSDSARPLPSGVLAVTGQMPHLSTAAQWLALAENQLVFVPYAWTPVPASLNVPDAIARWMAVSRHRLTNILAMSSFRRTPNTNTQAIKPLSIPAGRGFALGTAMFAQSSTVTVGVPGSSMFSVMDVEINFQIRPQNARRIIGATSIRGVT